MNHKLALVVLNYNDAKTTLDFVKKIVSYTVIKTIIIVDNYSTDNSFQVLQLYNNSKVHVVRTERNGGYGFGNNYGIKYINSIYTPTHILICNPDVEIAENVIEKMLLVFEQDNSIAAVAPFMLNRNGEKESGTAWKIPKKYEYIFSADLFCGHFLKLNKYIGIDKITDQEQLVVDCVAGSLLMVDNKKMLENGMYDENIFLYGEETTLGCKFRNAGYKTILLLQETFLHIHGVSINKSIQSDIKRRRMILNSRLYILKTYLKANSIDIFIARLIYWFSIIEYALFIKIKRISSHK